MDSTHHIATGPVVPGPLPVMSRRDVRAVEKRVSALRRTPPHVGPVRAVPKRTSFRRRASAGSAMSLIALFTVSVSLPALALNASPDEAAATVAVNAAVAQTLSFSGTTSTLVQRDGFTVTDIPKPASFTEVAAGGTWTSLSPSQLSDQGWALPVLGRITSPFGPRPNRPVAGVGAYHSGTDIAAPCGRPVFAGSSGTVVNAGYQGSYGNWVLIEHGNGIQTGYAHNSKLLVKAGQSVSAGEVIALVGTTGASSGCHVHFETRVDGTRSDPETFMNSRGVSLD